MPLSNRQFPSKTLNGFERFHKMLRLPARSCTSRRLFHTRSALLAGNATKPAYKKNSDGHKTRKTAGSHKTFLDHVSTSKYHKKGPSLEGIPVLSSESTTGIVGKYEEKQLVALTKIGSLKKNQHHELFGAPITIVRPETKLLQEFVEKSSTSPSTQNRICLYGDVGTGKTTLLAQTHASLLEKSDSIIIPISYAFELVNGRLDYLYVREKDTYYQPMYLKKFLKKIRDTNSDLLSKISLKNEYSIRGGGKNKSTVTFGAKHTLLDLLKFSCRPASSGAVFEALFKELASQDQFPVFLTVDSITALISNNFTEYRDPSNKKLHVSRFQIANTIFDFASGKSSFKKGGVILLTSGTDRPTDTIKVGLGLQAFDPYFNESLYDDLLAKKLHGVQPFKVDPFNKEQVTELVSTLRKLDAFQVDEVKDISDERLGAQKYILSGNGNPRELIKSIAFVQ